MPTNENPVIENHVHKIVPETPNLRHLIPCHEAFQVLKRALGIAADAPLQRIVIDVDCEKGVPMVYVRGVGGRPAVEAAAGLFQVKAVEDVTVEPDGTVHFREFL